MSLAKDIFMEWYVGFIHVVMVVGLRDHLTVCFCPGNLGANWHLSHMTVANFPDRIGRANRQAIHEWRR